MTTMTSSATMPLTPTDLEIMRADSPRTPQRRRWPMVCSTARTKKSRPCVLWARWRYSSGISSAMYVRARKCVSEWHFVT